MHHRATPLLAVLAIAGCTQPWSVIRSSGTPSALVGAQRLTVAWDASSLYVDGRPRPEREETMSPSERSSLDAAIREMERTFVGELGEQLDVPILVAAGDVAEGEVHVVIRPTELQRGSNGAVGAATVLVTRLDWMVGDRVVDAIQIREVEAPSLRRPSATDRMRIAAARSAQLAARFFQEAQGR